MCDLPLQGTDPARTLNHTLCIERLALLPRGFGVTLETRIPVQWFKERIVLSEVAVVAETPVDGPAKPLERAVLVTHQRDSWR